MPVAVSPSNSKSWRNSLMPGPVTTNSTLTSPSSSALPTPTLNEAVSVFESIATGASSPHPKVSTIAIPRVAM